MPTDLRVGPIALALMHHFEERRLTAYRCPADVPTIGWGNTYYLDGSRVRMGRHSVSPVRRLQRGSSAYRIGPFGLMSSCWGTPLTPSRSA